MIRNLLIITLSIVSTVFYIYIEELKTEQLRFQEYTRSHLISVVELPEAPEEKQNKQIVYVGMDKTRLEYTITKVLKYMSEDDLEGYTSLLMYTALVESNLGIYRKQKRGPALSVFQIEPLTEKSIKDVYLKRNPIWRAKIEKLRGNSVPGLSQLETNLEYATAMAYMLYKWRVKELSKDADLETLANYHKKYFNTSKGKSCPVKGVKMAAVVGI